MNFPFRPYFSNFIPYSSGKSEFSGIAKIYLDTNENPYSNGMNRYPDPMQTNLRKQIAFSKNKQFGSTLSFENILLGNGSDELIALLVQLFCEPKEQKIAICPPTFGMYAVAAKLFQVSIEEHWQEQENNTWKLPQSIFSDISSEVSCIFLCHPNNPTGQAIPLDQIEKIVKKYPEKMIIVDEAYSDFCEEKSVLSWLSRYENLIVIHTFSKMWGLAGARCGALFAHSEVIQKLSALKMPYNINVLTAESVEMAIDHEAMIFAQRETLLLEKQKMETFFTAQKEVVRVYHSDSNFLLVQWNNSEALFEHLKSEGIIIRNFSGKKGLENCLRFTIGTKEENEEVQKSIINFINNDKQYIL